MTCVPNYFSEIKESQHSKCVTWKNKHLPKISSFSSVVSSSLWPYGLQHARVPCLSPTPRACSDLFQWVCDAIQPSHPLSFPSPLAFNLFQHRCLSNELALRMDWPKCWSFSFSISPFNEYSRLISFWIDWFEIFSVQGTLKSLLQHHSSKTSILQLSTFFIILYPQRCLIILQICTTKY